MWNSGMVQVISDQQLNIDFKTRIQCLLFLTMILKIVIRNCADVQIISVVGAFPPNAFPLAKRTIYSAENGVKMMMILMMM